MKKKRHNDRIFRNMFIAFWITMALFASMLIVMLVKINVYNDKRSVWPILAIVSAVLWVMNFIIMCRYIYNNDKVNARKSDRSDCREANKHINTYAIENLNNTNILESFCNLLSEFIHEDIQLGTLFYKQEKFLNKNEIKIYCILNSDVKNTYDIDIENQNIECYSNEIISFFDKKGISSALLNCVFVLLTNFLKEDEKDFYRRFTGYWDCDIIKNKVVKNRSFNYCCLDFSTREIYFYESTKYDEGDEANLSQMILEDFNIKKCKF